MAFILAGTEILSELFVWEASNSPFIRLRVEAFDAEERVSILRKIKAIQITNRTLPTAKPTAKDEYKRYKTPEDTHTTPQI